MHLGIIDIAAAYKAETPYAEALGGTQAAVCYLSAELAKRGVKVSLLNQQRARGTARGVENLPPETLDDDAAIGRFDALIFNGRWTESLVRILRKRSRAKFIGWLHEASFNDPWILPLQEMDGFVCVSHWQQRMHAPLFPAHAKTAIIGHGIAPPFHALPLPVARQANAAPILAYIGSSKRGLLYLPDILPRIHAARPDAVFDIYNDGVVGLDEAENAAFLQKLRALPNVRHVGAVAQAELALRLGAADYLISPNTYPETFCISLAEAMAAGLGIVTTRRAALAETAAGFAMLVDVPQADSVDDAPGTLDVGIFCNAVLARMEADAQDAEAALAKRIKQATFGRTHYDWAKRAQSWMGFLGTLL